MSHNHHLSSSMKSSSLPALPSAFSGPVAAEDIAIRAYEKFLQRSDGPGSADEDWLAAEQDLRAEALLI